MSATLMPCSCFLRIATICVSVNLVFFMVKKSFKIKH
jgi:hypothetical protein